MKVSKIIPLLKSGKPNFLIEGYRPINVLGPLDKLFQEHFKNHMMAFFDQNNIISPMHHGGRKGHGTISALSLMLNFLQIQKDKKYDNHYFINRFKCCI